MKIVYYITILSLFFLFCSCSSTPEKTEVFKVWGNCDKCKKTIETAITTEGVVEKSWNVDSKLMTVKFDTTKITLDYIQLLIARSGYDNDTYYGDDYSYTKLPECCQYERKPFEMK